MRDMFHVILSNTNVAYPACSVQSTAYTNLTFQYCSVTNDDILGLASVDGTLVMCVQ